MRSTRNVFSRRTRKEVAALEVTPALSLALYLFASGLNKYFRDMGDRAGAERSDKLASDLFNNMDRSALTREKFPKLLIGAKRSAEQLETAIPAYRSLIKANFTNNPKVSKEEAQILNFAALFIRKPQSPGYISRVLDAANRMGSGYASMFTKAVHGKVQSSEGARLQDELYATNAAILGTKDRVLSVPADVLNELKQSKDSDDVDLARSYTRLRTQLRKQQLLDLSNAVASNGGKPLSVFDANEYLYDMGYDGLILPQLKETDPLFVGVDSGKVQYYTDDGRKLVGGIPVNAINIVFKQTYNPADGTGQYVSYRIPDAKGIEPTKLYTTAHKNKSTEVKHQKSAAVAENINKFLKIWSKDLHSRQAVKFMSATAAILVYLTGMRVGSRVEARGASGQQTQGALTLQVKNVKVTGNKFTVSYVGKKGVSQNHTIEFSEAPLNFKSAFLDLLADKKPSDYVFSTEDASGNLDKLKYTEFNAYLKAIGFPAGIHKIRHARGTELMVDLLAKKTWKPPATAKTLAAKQKSAEDFVKEDILSPVAKLLGHKKATGEPLWTTSIQNYCSPGPLKEWFIGHSLRVPKWVPTKLAD